MELTRIIDKVASSLEEKGLIKEAMELDVISNTLDKIFKEAWTAQQSPQYFTLESIKRALKMKNTTVALALLENNIKGKDMILKLYGDYKTEDGKYPAWEYADSYTKIIENLKNNDIDKAYREIDRAQKALIDLEPIITERQIRGPKRDISDTAKGTAEMIFSKGKKPIVTEKGESLIFSPLQKKRPSLIK